jgi:hypothetical protein
MERSLVNLPAAASVVDYRHDLNGDSLVDVFVVFQRRIMIFFQDKSKGFPSAPDVEIGADEPIPTIYAQVGIGKVSDKPGDQLVFFGPEGVDYVSLGQIKDSKSQPVEPQILFSRQVAITAGPLLDICDGAMDLDHDGWSEITVPVGTGLEVYSRDTLGAYRPVAKIPMAVSAQQSTSLDTEQALLGSAILNTDDHSLVRLPPNRRNWHSVRYANSLVSSQTVALDYNQDGKIDFIAPGNIRLQSDNLSFPSVSSKAQSQISFSYVPHSTRNMLALQPNLADFNGDKIWDTYSVEVSAARLSPRTDIAISLGQANRMFSPQPDMVLRTRDFAYSDALPIGDLNGDGANDLGLFHLDFQASSANSQFKAYLRKGLDGDLRFYLWDKERNRFPDNHSFRFPVLVNYDIYGARQFFRQQVVINSDMDGDSRPDLVIKTGPQQFSVFRNTFPARPGFDTKPLTVVATSPTKFSSIHVSDLNGDKRGDVVVAGYIEGQDDRIIYSFYLSH